MIRFRRLLFAVVTVFPAVVSAISPYVQMEGRGFGFRDGGGVVGWTPIVQRRGELAFAQGNFGFYRGYLFGQSLGGGYRRFVRGNLVVGANAFFDLTQSTRNIGYYQGGLGLEALGPRWEARFNGYAPGLRTSRRGTGAVIEGTRVVSRTKIERSYGGVDGEVGVGMPLGPGEGWIHAGYNGFFPCDARAIQGPVVRAEYRWYDFRGWEGVYVALGGEWSYDRDHKSQGALVAALRIPLSTHRSCGRRSSLCYRFSDPVRRQRTIWVERERDDRFFGNIFFVDNLTNGIGTQTNPMTLANAVALSGPGDVIFLLQNTGNVPVPGTTFQMKDRQQAAGFGNGASATVTLPSGVAVRVNDLTGAGRALLQGGTNAITLANGNQVFGIGVQGYTNAGVFGSGISGGSISDVDFVLAGGLHGVELIGTGGSIDVRDSNFIGAGGTNAARLVNAQGNFTFDGNQVTGSFRALQVLQNAQANPLTVTATGNTIQTVSQVALVQPSSGPTTVVFEGNIISNVVSGGLPAISFVYGGGSNHGFRVNNNIFTNINLSGQFGVSVLGAPTGTIEGQVRGNTFTSLTGIDVVFNPTGGTYSAIIENNTDITGTGAIIHAVVPSSPSATICARINGNTGDRASAAEILVFAIGGSTLNVEDLPNLSANNGGMTVFSIGAVNVPPNTCPCSICTP